MKALGKVAKFVAKLPNTKIGKKIGKAVDTKAGWAVDQFAAGGIFTALFKPTPEHPIGHASPGQWVRAIAQLAITAYLIYKGDIESAISFYEANN